jgi:ribonuclease D
MVHGDLPGDLATLFGAAARVAVDVETTGLDWRRDRLATCQLFGESVGVVLVRIEDDTPTRLASLLESSTVEKVFHHAPFDLRFMVHTWDIQPAAIRCTKVASKLLDPGAPNETHTLQRLVARHLGVALSKGSVRTGDWRAAMLSQDQLDYAAADVVHLLALFDILRAELQHRKLNRLYDDCCAFLPTRVLLELFSYPDVFAY